jgi:DNA-directed RNA polymerase subunit K/omega
MEHRLVKDSKVKDAMDSKFRYVLVVAERTEQLMRGARAKLELPAAKETRVAQEEIDQELVEWDYGPEPPLEMPSDEALAAASAEAAAAEADEDSDDDAVH